MDGKGGERGESEERRWIERGRGSKRDRNSEDKGRERTEEDVARERGR